MTRSIAIILSLATLTTLATSNAFAQGKTRAEVYQELIEAQQNGLNFVTETSYPDVSPIYEEQVARMKREHLARQHASAQDAQAH
ncbi:MAG: DUF4148 domain-containing protein [Trinickia sp.]|jgi:hypothetical protein